MNLLAGLLFRLFLFPSAHALSLGLDSVYDQSETIVAEIQGVVLQPISPSQVTFTRGHVETVVTHDVQRLGDSYFIYFIAPRAQHNYTLTIRDVDTMINGERQLATLERPFATSNQSVPYSVRPGFINIAEDFEIEFTSFSDQPLNLALGAPFNSNMTLQPGITTRSFPLDAFSQGLSVFSLGMYSLPIYNAAEVGSTKYVSRLVSIFPRSIEHVFIRGRESPFLFTVKNIGTEVLEDVLIVYNESRYTLTPKVIKRIGIDESVAVNITLKQFNTTFDDKFTIRAGNESIEIPLKISYNETLPILINRTSNDSVQGYYCNELGGKICTTNERCEGSTISSLSGSCCIGSCIVPEKSSLAWLGYLFGAIVLIVLVIVGGKYMKSRGRSSSGLTGRLAKLEHA